MKSLMQLFENVLADASTWCRTSTTRDWVTITRRVEHEGLSFLTITLPSFCQDFERSLEEGRVDPSHFRGFSRCGALPRFLGGLLGLVFDPCTGVLLNSAEKEMSKNNNRAVVPGAQQALNNFKNEIASELGIANIVNTQGWANMTSADCGRVGGHMVRKMIEAAEQSLAGQVASGVKTGFASGMTQAQAQPTTNTTYTAGSNLQ